MSGPQFVLVGRNPILTRMPFTPPYRVKEASKGYFHDYNALRHEGGKAYLAPKTLIREDVRF